MKWDAVISSKVYHGEFCYAGSRPLHGSRTLQSRIVRIVHPDPSGEERSDVAIRRKLSCRWTQEQASSSIHITIASLHRLPTHRGPLHLLLGLPLHSSSLSTMTSSHTPNHPLPTTAAAAAAHRFTCVGPRIVSHHSSALRSGTVRRHGPRHTGTARAGRQRRRSMFLLEHRRDASNAD